MHGAGLLDWQGGLNTYLSTSSAVRAYLRSALALLSFSLFVAHANGSQTFTLNLTGIVSNGFSGSYEQPTYRYDYWGLSLSGLTAANSILVSEGDTINAAVILDQPLTVPASIISKQIDLFLFGVNFPNVQTITEVTTSFYLGGVAGVTQTTSVGYNGAIAGAAFFSPPDNGPIIFDSVTYSINLTSLSSPGSLDSAQLYYFLFAPPVPEPSQFVLLMLGIGFMVAANAITRGRFLSA